MDNQISKQGTDHGRKKGQKQDKFHARKCTSCRTKTSSPPKEKHTGTCM